MTQIDPLPQTAAGDVDLTGRRLGDYHILRRLGRGGMAEVYLAEQQSLSRRVAFKALKANLASDEKYVRRFLHEAKAAAALVHANIVQVYEVGCIDGVHFIAQEYVEGQNLKQLLDRQGALPVAMAVRILRQVAAALQRAGQQKITHRDIKPENIMLSVTGEVKVADFGLARVERDGQSMNLTQVGVTMGTPLYMSPEQVAGRAVDARSDIYSLGITCFQMVAARPPFEGDTPLNLAIQHLHNEPPRLEDLRPDLPESLCRIIHKMMAKRPEDRYATAGEVLRELRSLPADELGLDGETSLEEWTTTELAAHADARAQATQQLAAVMRDESRAATPWRGFAWISAASLAALLLGVTAAWLLRPASLLAVSPGELPAIERQPTVQDQYFEASKVNTLEAYQSIPEYFPPEQSEQNRYYARRAKQRMAELNLSYERRDQAMKLYEELAATSDDDAAFRAIGLAGQIQVHLRRKEREQAEEKLQQLRILRDKLPPQYRALLGYELVPELRGDFPSR